MERKIYTKARMLQYLKEEMPEFKILIILVIDSVSYFQDESSTINNVIQFAKAIR